MPKQKFKKIHFEKRINVIKSDIYKDFIGSDDYTKISFYQVLNRLIILIQHSVCFVLYEKINNTFETKHLFLQDELYLKILNEKLSNIYKELNKYVFRIYDSNYYIVIFKIKKSDASSYDINNTTFEFVENINNNIENLNGYISCCCCSILGTGKKIGDLKNPKYANLILSSVENLKDTQLVKNDISNISDSKDQFKDNIINEFNEDFDKRKQGNYQYIEIKRNSCFNLVYRKIRKSISFIENNNNNCSNVFFNIRNYKINNKKRFHNSDFNGYNYNINYILPNNQKEDLLKFLSSLINKKDKIIRYKDYVEDDEIKKDAVKIDDLFWKTLDEKGKIGLIKDTFSDEISGNSRSFSDRVYNDGLLYFYMPFEYGGLRRLISGYNSDRLKLVFLYYFCIIHFPEIDYKKEKIGLIISPIMISNIVWGSIIHFIVINDDYNEINDSYFKDKSTWLRNYQYYNSVALRSERLFKTEIKYAYLTYIKNIYFKHFNVFIENMIKSGVEGLNSSILSFEHDLNHSFYELTRFFPFSSISVLIEQELDISSYAEIDEKTCVYFAGKSGRAIFSSKVNSFFPSTYKSDSITDVNIENDVIPIIEITQNKVEEKFYNEYVMAGGV